jgi:ubiquinone/menaquinone biosynthesis C-methylase UbiE
MYVHGYGARESERLQDQADSLVDLLHHDTEYADGSLVLEAGCGVGSQTITLAKRSPGARFVSVDRSLQSLAQAHRRIVEAGLTNVEFRQEDIFALPFAPASFDHVFACSSRAAPSRRSKAITARRTSIPTVLPRTVPFNAS